MLVKASLILIIIAAVAYMVYLYLNEPEECVPIPENMWKAVYPNTDWSSGSFYARAPVSQCECQNLIMDEPNAPGGVYDSNIGACYLKNSMGSRSRTDDLSGRYTSFVKN